MRNVAKVSPAITAIAIEPHQAACSPPQYRSGRRRVFRPSKSKFKPIARRQLRRERTKNLLDLRQNLVRVVARPHVGRDRHHPVEILAVDSAVTLLHAPARDRGQRNLDSFLRGYRQARERHWGVRIRRCAV